ncbi:hypothetical protein SETIT_3G059300v2 [Setaria italica]|uniref:PDZ domain-containing protein n=1 Tax=Setaria italica TaxID=4555 RepID=K3Z5A7_SETIT|nr:hypothetical protein SETIT_3G059300v2 [Setaria italica]RCV15481.1 hypothetical protein SETIT_3G059300v2 [Setaria italica]
MAPTTKEEEGGEAWESRLLRRRTPAGSPTPPAGTAPSPPPSQRGKRERPGSSRGRKRARATGREDEKDAEAAAASASPPAGHASSGASSGTSSPLRWPELPRAVLGEDSYGEQILEPFHEIDPAIVRAHGKLKTKYFAKLDRQLKLVSLDQRIPSSCMVDPRLLSVRKAATNSILQIAKVTVGLSSYIDDKMLGRTSGFLIDWDVENRIGTVLTSALVIQSKSPSLDEWSATDEYATHAEVRVHFMDKAATTVVANLLHYDKHYNLALFKVSMDLSAQIPSFTSELKFAEEVFVLGRDEGRYLTIDHGNVAYEGPSRLQRHHYMFITRRINKLGIGGPVINHGGQVAGMYSHPGLAFTPSSIILRCLQMWKSFNCILRLHVGMKFSAISLLDLPHREVIACKCDIDDGLIVTQVSEGSIAEKLGVRHGDIIKSWNGENISTTIELENFLLDMCEKHLDKGNSIGSSVDLSIGIFHTRKGKHGTIKMTVNVSDDVEVIAEGTYPVTTADCTSGDDDDSGIIQGECLFAFSC